ncbi:MAG: M48 family metallopeptidase [Eubacteriales bacterium]|nr:M48 family metallopeptidase [Eubacteriales bacterium]
MQYLGFNIEVIRSDRKTIGLQVKRDGRVILRAPRGVSEKQMKDFVREKSDWLRKSIKKVLERKETAAENPISMDEVRRLADRALAYIPGRVSYYARKMGVTYGRITIRNQTSRWGSCTSAGNLNFNCLLMLTPPEVIDSVVVHELAHRKEMNHSAKFYEVVRRAYPEYDKWNGWLKKNGTAIIARMRAGGEAHDP